MADARRAPLKDQTDISGAKALIVEARFYDDIQDALLEGAVAELKAAGVSLPVIYITGKDTHATRMAAMASGCIAYLTKPFAARSLIEPIERACAGLA